MSKAKVSAEEVDFIHMSIKDLIMATITKTPNEKFIAIMEITKLISDRLGPKLKKEETN